MEVTLLKERANDVLTKDNLKRLPFVINRVLKEKKEKEKLNTTLFELAGNLKFQEALAEISIRFNSTESFDSKIYYALEILGKVARVSRVYLFEDFENGKFTKNTFEWCAEDVSPQIEELQKVSYNKDIPSWKPHLIREGRIFCFDITELDDDIRDILEPQEIKAVIVYPIYAENKFIGFIGFDEVRNTRTWTSSEDKLLKSVSGIISNILGEKKAKDELEASNEKLSSLLEEKEVLVGEVHHRVKNNLALISSFLQLEQLGVTSGESKEKIISANILRIKSIGIVHETVYQLGSFSNIEVVKVLVEIIRANYREKGEIQPIINIQKVDVPVTFNINIAVPFSLLISELMFQVLNLSGKKAYKSKGEMWISASKDNNKFIVSIIEPNLTSVLSRLQKEEGFSEIIEVLAKQIGSHLELDLENGKTNIFFKDKKVKGSSSTLV